MNKVNKIACVMSGLGLILSVIALIMLAISSEPFFSELSANVLATHPLVWVVISGVIFFPTVTQLLKEMGK